MIRKPEWFARRKYTGWGLTPATWQGWLYIICLAAVPFAITMITAPGSTEYFALLGAWAIFLGIDIIDTMRSIRSDERERLHEAVAERNAAWAMIAVLTIGIAYQVAQTVATKTFKLDPFLIVAALSAVAAKAYTNYKLDKEN